MHLPDSSFSPAKLSEQALSEIQLTTLADTIQPVCHHLGSQLDWVTRENDEEFLAIKSAMEALGLSFSINGLEAWEDAVVDAAWISRRPFQVEAAAATVGFTYSGWSWEPKGHRLIAATDFAMVDNRGVSDA